jgi:tRNA 5-methylaminomethyl-2-thiouridine biosynthesis bifunctional protein
LLGEHVAALVLDTPSPLPQALAARVAPDRPAVRRQVKPSPA